MSATLQWVGPLFLGIVCAAARAPAGTASGPRAVPKKLIQYGWGIPTPDFIREHIREMEKRPFDGLIFQLHGAGRVLEPQPLPEAKLAKDLDDLKHIEWKKFTDNFIVMWAASKQDWFNDEHWKAIEHNVRLLARAARVGRCVGVCFDPEPYGANPWAYSQAPHRKTKSFADYEAIVRRRGAQFIRAVQAEMPKARVLTFFQLSILRGSLRPMDPKQRAAGLAKAHYGLLAAFLNGMLDAAGDEVTIIDGNETAYYYTDSRQHLDAYHCMRQRGLALIDPKLWGKYRRHVRAGQALYIDQCFGLRTRKVLGHYMTPDERRKWFEHNVYWALATADRYVWCYGERMHWWKNEKIPPGCEEAIVSARRKRAAGQPLGFDIRGVIDAARKRQRAAGGK